MQIVITSDLTKDGTEVTVDGKKIKNVHCVDFDMYHNGDMPPVYDPSNTKMPAPAHYFSVRVTSKEQAEDGTDKCVVYKFNRTDDGEVKDSIEDITPTKDQLAKAVADMMIGRKNRPL